MKVGDLVVATIAKVADMGIFVNIDGKQALLVSEEISSSKADVFMKHARIGAKMTVIIEKIDGDYIDVSKKNVPKKYRKLHKKKEKEKRVVKATPKESEATEATPKESEATEVNESEETDDYKELIGEIVTDQPDEIPEQLEHLIIIELGTIMRSFEINTIDLCVEMLKYNLNSQWRGILSKWMPEKDIDQAEFLVYLYESDEGAFKTRVDFLLKHDLVAQESLDIFLDNSSDVEL